MKLTVFGATGQTGTLLVEQALSAGDEVIACVRTPSKLTVTHQHLTVVPGDATDPAAVERAIQGTDAVISVLATQRKPIGSPLTRATENIVAAMEKTGVRRLVASAPGVAAPDDSFSLRFMLWRAFVRCLVPRAFRDSAGSAQAVQASTVDWTVVRMTIPTHGPRTGHVTAGYPGRSIGMRISRADAAAFMLNEVREAKYVRHSPVICSR
jgi:putative NADH-flavin reductase